MSNAQSLTAEEIISLDERLVSPSTRIPFLPLVVEEGKGAELIDRDGRKLLDFHSMACITNTGHCHPRIVEAIQRQAGKLLHANTAYVFTESLATLAAELTRITPGNHPKRVAFGTAGSDANDGAIKLSRAATGRSIVISFFGAYHGNTYGAVTLSGVSLAMRRGFGPLLPDVLHTTYPNTYRPTAGVAPHQVSDFCLSTLRNLLETVAPPEEVAAVFLEPIQGDSGILVPPQEFVDGLVSLCRENGILIVAEEVQTGLGRSGPWFASEHFNLEPDITIIGKALGSGLPISAIVARSELMDCWQAPGHVISVAAGPVCCAAALATIATIEEEGLLENGAAVGARLKRELEGLQQKYEAIGDVRGRGLMLGVDIVKDRDTKEPDSILAAKILYRCKELGLYLTFLAGSVLRIAPPLVLTMEQADTGLDILATAIDDGVNGLVPDEAVRNVAGW